MQSAPDADALAAIARRLDRIEEGLARGVPPALTLHGTPEPAGGERTATKEAPEARSSAIASEIEALKERLAAIAVTQEAVAKKLGVPPPWPSDPAEVERIRERWRSQIEATEKALWAAYPQGPDPRGDPVVWSRFDDHRKAKAAFEAAPDSASLRALSEGEFRSYFTVAR